MMLADYFREKDGAETIVASGGFLAYLIRKDQLFITDFYIRPEARQSKENFLELMRKAFDVALEHKLDFFTCRVYRAQKNFDSRVLAYLKFGFKITETEPSHIGMALELRGCEWAAVAETRL